MKSTVHILDNEQLFKKVAVRIRIVLVVIDLLTPLHVLSVKGPQAKFALR